MNEFEPQDETLQAFEVSPFFVMTGEYFGLADEFLAECDDINGGEYAAKQRNALRAHEQRLTWTFEMLAETILHDSESLESALFAVKDALETIDLHRSTGLQAITGDELFAMARVGEQSVADDCVAEVSMWIGIDDESELIKKICEFHQSALERDIRLFYSRFANGSY